MAIIDRRIEKLHTLNKNLPCASTFGEWLGLVQEQHALKETLCAELAEVNRLARGWTYIPPPKLR